MPAKLPTVRLQMSGTLADHPSRYADRKNEPHPELGLGNPPAEFDAAQRKVWRELAKCMPDGVFTVADRFLAEQACRLIVKMRDDTMTTQQSCHLTGVLSKLGLSPTDRSKVNAPSTAKPKPKDDWSFKSVRTASAPVRTTDSQWSDTSQQVDPTSLSALPN